MANIRISQLPTASSLTGTELVPIVQNGLTSQTTVGAFSSTFTFPQTFLTIGAQASLPNSRYIAVSTGLTGTDGGIGNAYTLSLSNTGVTAGTYTFPTITVNAQGQITSASSNAGEITTLSFGSTGLTPNTPTSGAITVAGTLAVANGGTGVTTSTGTGSVVLSTSPTLVTPTLGAASATSIAVSYSGASGAVGSLNIGGSLNGASDTGIITSFVGTADTYAFTALQNKNTSATANTSYSSYALYNNLGNVYGEIGMNSSTYSYSAAGFPNNSLSTANALFIEAGSGAELVLGTFGSNGIHFVTNGTSNTSDAMFIPASGPIQAPVGIAGGGF